MVNTALEKDTRELRTKIAALHTFFKENNNLETAVKAKQLADKLIYKEFAIAFCGHFSAGKSSMINKLMGINLLPASPIPTSANLVKVKSGEEYAKVFFKERKPRVYLAPYNYELVKSFCKDGDQIQSIEISHNTENLPIGTCIMDTPGIDSTDDAHRIATESALHLADLVFYVMDYNHVQAEVNFLFTKELTDAGKDVYLVINQIDKHREEELSFEQFKNSVLESFATWGVDPARIFYTSLKIEEHKHNNDFKELQSFIHSKWEKRLTLLPLSIEQSLRKLVEEHQRYLKERDQEQINNFNERLSVISHDKQERLSENLDKVNSELESIATFIDDKENEIIEGVDNVLKSAYLMPFQTRELASAYLQARQANFKVGLFFSKQKTEQERKVRLEKLYVDFQGKVKSGLEWHLKQLLLNTLKNNQVHDSILLSEVQNFSVSITQGAIEKTVMPGAHVTGESVLNYANDLSELAKGIARRQVQDIKASYLSILVKRREAKRKELETSREKLTSLLSAWNKKQALLKEQRLAFLQMEQYLGGQFNQEDFVELYDGLASIEEDVEIIESLDQKIQGEDCTSKKVEEAQIANKSKGSDPDKIRNTVNKLKYASAELRSIPGFKKITEDLFQKAERIENRGFTVALFGAFSAGKSSFANALIGEKLLPVSPNPTTATINKIKPVDEQHAHGLVKVKLKEQNALLEELCRSLAVFDLAAHNFDDAKAQIEKLLSQGTDSKAHEKTHFAFLKAFYQGVDEYRALLGEIIVTDLSELKDFVAKEEKSCLVESIEVYFDCELTRKGITLVDTPGADSINVRHTGVAFEYIKNSDAILFVTYYNHAFSKADREFLIQLGRVKDSFELDKMFFIVNAVDLANNEEEKMEVLNYVKQHLITYGIRQPNLFPISSLYAIKEKLGESTANLSGIQNFEERFYSFITHDLTDIMINAGLKEWQRAVDLLKSYILSAQQDISAKEEKVANLQQEQKSIEEFIKAHSTELLQQRLRQEIDELIYYIKQRVFFRFNDFFKEAFNPYILRDDGRDLKRVLAQALEDFLKDFGFDFAQELRATTLRVDTFIGKVISDFQQRIIEELLKINHELSYSQYQISSIEPPEFDIAFMDLEREIFKKPLAYFKNPKAFFENNEKRFMREELEKLLQQPSAGYLEKENRRLKVFYMEHLNKEIEDLFSRLCEETKEYYEGMYAALGNEVSVEELIQIKNKVCTF